MEMNHVLVVEDDKEIRQGIEIYLKSQGYEVYQAEDGIEGLEVIEKEEIRSLRAHIKKLREPLNGSLHRLRQRFCRLMGEAGMCINQWQILHL